MAKKLRDEDLILNIIVNGDAGRKEIKQQTDAVKKLREENKQLIDKQKELAISGKETSNKYKEFTAQIEKNNAAIVMANERITKLQRGMKVTEMSIAELRKEKGRLMALFNTSTPRTQEWYTHAAALKVVEVQMHKLSIEARGASQAYGFFRRNILVINTALASLSGAFMIVNSAKNKFLQRDERYANVTKTTSMLRDEVKGLDKDLQKIDTRTAQNDLLDLATVAGKIGLKDSLEVEGFVNAADKIKVALGEDLGDDAETSIREIGKLVDIFKINKDFPLEEAMLKTGSAINDAGASSTAQEKYIVNFLYRIGSTSASVKQSMSDAIGLAATLDSKGLRSEMAATAVSNLMRTMFTDSTQFAKMANMELEEFTTLLENDFNSAFISVLDGISKFAPAELVAQLGSVGLTGTEAINTITTLAGSIDMLQEQQLISNRAFKDGTSIVDEFNIKNNTSEAKLEKNKKKIEELSVALGAKLTPIILLLSSSGKVLLELFVVMIEFLYQNKIAFISAGAGVVIYYISIKAAVIETKLLSVATLANGKILIAHRAFLLLTSAGWALMTGNVIRAKAAMVLFNQVVKISPIGLFIGVVTAAVVAIDMMSRKVKDISLEMRSMNKEIDKSVREETTNIRSLLNELENENTTKKRKLEIQKELTSALDDGTIAIDKEAIASGKARVELEKYFEAKRKLKRLDMIDTKIAELEIKAENPELSAWQQIKAHTMSKVSGDLAGHLMDFARQNQEDIIKEKSGWEAKYKQLLSESIKYKNSFDKDGKKIKVKNSENGSAPTEEIDVINNSAKTVDTRLEEINNQVDTLNAQRLTLTVGDSAGMDKLNHQIKELQTEKSKLMGEYTPKIQNDTQKDTQKDALKNDRTGKLQDFVDNNIEDLVEREKKAYQNRLKDYGLFSRDRSSMTKLELNALAILEREHASKVDDIISKQLRDELSAKTQIADDCVAITRSRHLRELANFVGNEEELKELKIRQAQEQLDVELRALNAITEELEGIRRIGTFDGKSGIVILTEEQKNDINKRLQEIADKRNKLKADRDIDTDTKDVDKVMESIHIPMIGGSVSEWEQFFDVLRDGKFGIEDLSFSLNTLSNVFGAVNKAMSMSENNQLKRFETDQRKKTRLLKAQLDRGAISQEQYNSRVAQNQELLDKKKAEIEARQAKRNKAMSLISAVINTSVGVTQALAGLPWPMNLVIASLVAALGAVEIGLIASQPTTPGYEKGGFTRVDGKKYVAEYSGKKDGYVGNNGPEYLVGENGGEFVVNNKSLQNPDIAEAVRYIDDAQRKGIENSFRLPKSSNGYESGGYTAHPSSRSAASQVSLNEEDLDKLMQCLDRIDKTMVGVDNTLKTPLSVPYKSIKDAEIKYNKTKIRF